jgi:hypothetical protein
VLDRVARRIDLPQRLALVARLPARRFAGPLAQTARAWLPLGLVQPVGGLPLLELFRPSRRSNSATRASNTAMVSWSAAFSARSCPFSSASAVRVAASWEGAVRAASSAGVMDRLTHMPRPASTSFLQGLPGQ